MLTDNPSVAAGFPDSSDSSSPGVAREVTPADLGCPLYILLLREDGLKLSDPCPNCKLLVAKHPLRDESSSSSGKNASVQRPHKATYKDSDVIRECPKWSSKSIAEVFLKQVELKFTIFGVPASEWNRLLCCLFDAKDYDDCIWIRENIMDKSLPWCETKTAFIKHFRNSDYMITLTAQYNHIKQSHDESVQHYSNRFKNLVSQLNYRSEDVTVVNHYIAHLKQSVHDKLIDQLMHIQISTNNPDYRFTSLQDAIDKSIIVDVAEKNAHQLASVNTGSAAKKKALHCDNHPNATNHTTAECKANKAKASQSSAPVIRAGHAAPATTSNKEDWKKSAQCHNCGGIGHIKPQCPHGNKGMAATSTQQMKHGSGSGTTSSATGTSSASSNAGPSSTVPPRHNPERNRQPPKRFDDYVAPTVSKAVRAVSASGDHEEEDGNGDGHGNPRSLSSICVSKQALDRSLPPTIFDSIGVQGEIWFLHQDRMYKTMVDSGADISCVDPSIVAEHNLEITPPGADKVGLAEDDTFIQRLGVVKHLTLTAKFVVGGATSHIPDKTFTHSFELMKIRKHGYLFLIGKDLIPVLFREHRGYIYSFLVPPASGAGDELGAKVAVVEQAPVADAAAAVLDASESAMSAIEELAGSGIVPEGERAVRVEVSTPVHLEAEYATQRKRLEEDAEIQEAFRINASLVGPCVLPEAVVELQVKEELKHTVYQSQYPIARSLEERADELIQRWIREGKVAPAPMGCPYNSPIMVAPKKDDEGNWTGIRVCLDTRRLNRALERCDRFQLPGIRRIFDKLIGMVIFGEFDLLEAYLQLVLALESQPYTAFTWRGKQYMFVCCPFGIEPMPSIFQRFITFVFGDYQFMFQYLDNLVFGSRSWEEHREHILAIVTRCNQANLKIKPSSIKFGHAEMRCLGHIISVRGIGVDPKKVQQVLDWPLPKTGEQLMSFLGTCTFLRDHIRHYADLAAPLDSVKMTKGEIEWTETMLHHFEMLKKALCHAPFLRLPDFNRPFHIATDASNTGVGGVLYQPDADDGDISPHNIVAICSKKLSKSQRNYSAYKKELWGIVYNLRQFHCYIYGRSDVVLYTDHKPLTYMFQTRNLSPALMQWLDVILDYSFEIRHRPGVLNVLADALSRMYASVYGDSPVWGIPSSIRGLAEYAAQCERECGTADVPDPVTAIRGARLTQSPANVREADADEEEQDPVLVQLDAQLASSPDVSKEVALAIALENRGKKCPASDAEKRDLIEKEHAFGHFGREAIYKKLYSKDYWWPNMRGDIQAVINDCDPCTRYVVTHKMFNPAKYITAEGPWSHIQIDYHVKMPESPDGYNCVFVAVCVFTGYAVLEPTRGNEATTTAEVLWTRCCCTLGLPKIIQSDNGSEFVSDVVCALTKLAGVDRRFISPYNPRADGKVERTIGTVMTCIKKMLHGTANHWPLYVPFAQLAYNNKIADLTGASPFSLMYGRSCNEPQDYTQPDAQVKPFDLSEWRSYQDKFLALILPGIADRIDKRKKKMVQTLNKHRKLLLPGSIPNGALVMLVDPDRGSKMDPVYVGPYTVVRRTRQGNYVLRDDNGDHLDRHVPPDQLKMKAKKPSDKDLDNKAYEVQSILKHRGKAGDYEYFVKWKDYNERSWVHESSFLDDLVIKNYWKHQQHNPSSQQ